MATVQHRNPVVVSHPVTGQYVTLARGKEFADDDPIVAAFGWAFAVDDAPADVDSVPIETATARPGERRGTRRR